MNKRVLGLTGLAAFALASTPLVIVHADDTATQLQSEGTVGFIANNDPHSPLNPLTPFDPDSGKQNNVEPKDGNTNSSDTRGNQLTLDYAPSFRFGTNNKITSGAHDTIFAQALTIDDKGTTVPNYAQVTDLRDSKTSGWQLKVTQDDDWTSTSGETIAGAEIKFRNVQDAISGQKANFAKPTTNKTVTITKGKSIELMNASSSSDTASRNGYGSWMYVIGDDNNKSSSVELSIPDNAVLSADTYKTNLTWSLEDTGATN